MKRTFLAITVLFSFALAAVGACAVDTPNFGDDDKWPCETDEDCTEPGQECQPHPENSDWTVCTTEINCIDDDNDGYGSPANAEENGGPGFSECSACPNEPRGCEADCDDDNSKIHPGAPERCDGADNDCDEQTDEMDCDPEEGCPFAFGAKEYDPPQDARWKCENVDGSDQCVMKGYNSGSDSCEMEKAESGEESTWGICQSNGQWSDVADACQ